MSTKASKNSRRKKFSDDQIKSLETTFESESRPELHLKQNLANSLGLQPRQVAIWFQNKRARSKSKQIEREYGILKSNYDNLASQMETLRKENQTLLIQVQRLRKMAGKRDGDENEKNHITLATSDNPSILLDINSHSHQVCMPLCSDQNRKVEEADVFYMAGIAQGSLASPENGCSFESCTFFEDTGSASRWWDFQI